MMHSTDAVLKLGNMAMAFGRVNRITYHDNGETLESDTDHTVMLGLVACAFAKQHFPALDVGLIAQYALVHDLVEVYAGDTPTLRINGDEQAAKEQRENEALRRITREIGTRLPWVHVMILLYEGKQDPESRYVKAMDKLLPKITHIANGLKTIHEQGMSRDELVARYERQFEEISVYASDFPELFDLRQELVTMVLAQYKDPESKDENESEDTRT
jgi:putative hydrolase of HD superfamily